MSVKTKRRTVKKLPQVKEIITETKVTETIPLTNEVEVETPEVETPEVQPVIISQPTSTSTLDSQSMLDDLMSETDKDSDTENSHYDLENDEDIISDNQNPVNPNNNTNTTNNTGSGSNSQNIADKFADTILTDNEDWQNPTDFRKMCAINAMMYVEGGAIFLSFLGQLISGDWSKEGENKYMASEERRKLIRNPLAKKFELTKNKNKSSPTGAMITAIIFTVLPIIIIAFKDRKAKIAKEKTDLENKKLKEELLKANEIIGGMNLQQQYKMQNAPQPVYVPQSNEGFLRVEKRGRHKKDCDCEKCNFKRMKTKKRK